MSHFADLTIHTYYHTGKTVALNIGWLDEAHPFPKGDTSTEFRDAFHKLCEKPSWLHRGTHDCQFCPIERLDKWPPKHPERMGNGQTRILGPDRVWYSAPTMVHHYVVEHGYLPPQVFIDAVLRPIAIGHEKTWEQ